MEATHGDIGRRLLRFFSLTNGELANIWVWFVSSWMANPKGSGEDNDDGEDWQSERLVGNM